MDSRICSTKELADLLGYTTDRSIQRMNLADDPLVRKAGHGRYQVSLDWLNTQRASRGLLPLLAFPGAQTTEPVLSEPVSFSSIQELSPLDLTPIEFSSETDLRLRVIQLEEQVRVLEQEIHDLKDAFKRQTHPSTSTETPIKQTYSTIKRQYYPPAQPHTPAPVDPDAEERDGMVWVAPGLVTIYSFAKKHNIPVNTLVYQAVTQGCIPKVDGDWHPLASHPSVNPKHALDAEGRHVAYLLHCHRKNIGECSECPHGVNVHDPATEQEARRIRSTARKNHSSPGPEDTSR